MSGIINVFGHCSMGLSEFMAKEVVAFENLK